MRYQSHAYWRRVKELDAAAASLAGSCAALVEPKSVHYDLNSPLLIRHRPTWPPPRRARRDGAQAFTSEVRDTMFTRRENH
jgi:hypothetical protein